MNTEQDLCTYGAKQLPDPFELETGWKSEEGISSWPLLPTFYINRFLMMDSSVGDLSNYKGSNAYSIVMHPPKRMAWKYYLSTT